jgi:hypothetical protein
MCRAGTHHRMANAHTSSPRRRSLFQGEATLERVERPGLPRESQGHGDNSSGARSHPPPSAPKGNSPEHDSLHRARRFEPMNIIAPAASAKRDIREMSVEDFTGGRRELARMGGDRGMHIEVMPGVMARYRADSNTAQERVAGAQIPRNASRHARLALPATRAWSCPAHSRVGARTCERAPFIDENKVHERGMHGVSTRLAMRTSTSI